jgi:predicted DNA-binding protein YlxM (UPF0122 family)
MDITRNVVLDLLPMYQAGEVSEDTKKLVEEYLETDLELAEIAKKGSFLEKPEEIPSPFGKEEQMEAYKEAQKMIRQRTIIWGSIVAMVIVSGLGLALLAFFMLVSSM